MNSSKNKLLLENFFIYGIGGIISKVIPIIMLPIITRLLPDKTYFGVNDLFITMNSLASVIASMGICDAMYRFFFENEERSYRIKVCSTSLCFVFFMSIIVSILMIVFNDAISLLFFKTKEYYYIVDICALGTTVGATNNIIATPTRMQNKRKIFLITNFVSSVLSYSISIPLILKGYYTVALPVASILAAVTMEVVFGLLNYKWFRIKDFDSVILKELLTFSLPLVPSFLIYWLFSSADRVMISNILSVGDAGVYAIGGKLGNLSQLIYSAFAGGWQFFSFSTMKDDNQEEYNSKLYEYLGIISFIATLSICAVSYLLYYILFPTEYLNGYIVSPYLFFSPLLQMLFQIAATQYFINKKTLPPMLMLFCGAMLNVLLNFFLIPVLKIEGAAIATMFGYALSVLMCTVSLVRKNMFRVSIRFLLSGVLLILFFVIWRLWFSNGILLGLMSLGGYILIIICLYFKDLQMLLNRICKKF